ncbi:MAG: TIGR04282 family arsenosugar biosynthesis glycosyltransferase [Candidatus Thiodiazotropha sp. (ex Monitilora ramsayi)]|nr:TIGR04282 family arsenosugar biosynthesis glycosyltransferase [Candidatus Thiodiazotropha sp. (ex Monitilora ramsayi)]
MPDDVVLIFTKPPCPGRVKTRLIPAIGEVAATKLYARLLQRQIAWIDRETPYDIELWVTSDSSHPLLQALESEYPLSIHLQQGGDLGERMGHAARQALKRYRRVVLLGVDCPALTAGHLQQAFGWLRAGEDAVLGPAEDGGYVLLGLNKWSEQLFQGHQWGAETVAQSTRRAFEAMGWRWRELPLLWDLDRPGDLERLARLDLVLHQTYLNQLLGPVNTNPIVPVAPEKASIKARGERFGSSK